MCSYVYWLWSIMWGIFFFVELLESTVGHRSPLDISRFLCPEQLQLSLLRFVGDHLSSVEQTFLDCVVYSDQGSFVSLYQLSALWCVQSISISTYQCIVWCHLPVFVYIALLSLFWLAKLNWACVVLIVPFLLHYL